MAKNDVPLRPGYDAPLEVGETPAFAGWVMLKGGRPAPAAVRELAAVPDEYTSPRALARIGSAFTLEDLEEAERRLESAQIPRFGSAATMLSGMVTTALERIYIQGTYGALAPEAIEKAKTPERLFAGHFVDLPFEQAIGFGVRKMVQQEEDLVVRALVMNPGADHVLVTSHFEGNEWRISAQPFAGSPPEIPCGARLWQRNDDD